MGIMGSSGSKGAAGPSRRRKTRSSTAAEVEAKQREEEEAHREAADSPSKKAKVSDEAELSKDMALAKALEAISEEQSAEEAEQKSSDEQVSASAEVLVTIPEAKVHLLEEQGSPVTLASGDFSITRILQNSSVVAVFAKVGDELQWPLAKDEPALKLSHGYYVFTLRLPVSVDEEEADVQQTKEGDAEEEGSEIKLDPGILNYGVIFHGDKYQEPLRELDNILENYSAFVPVPALKEEEVAEGSIVNEELGSEQQQAGAARPKKSDYYYKQLAPNVDAYNSALARSIATGSGQLIKGILWVSEVIATQIERSGLFMQKRLKPKTKPSKISPKTMKNIQRAKKISKMTENLASGMLSGVITATGSITSSLLRSKPAAKLFVKVFEALELAGKNVLSRTSFVTCQVVSHKYGDEAAALTKEGLSAAGNVVTTAWTISKIRTAIDPTKAAKNPIFIKAAASAAAEEMKDKKQT